MHRNLSILLLGPVLAAGARAQLDVVATIPDLADLARRIGGERVEVTAIARGRENIHAVRLKPSHIVAVSRADLFVQVGLSLEHAWVPGLLRTGRNRDVQPGGDGFVNASEGWEPIQVPATLSRRQGTDVHPQGNPHVNLDPEGGPHMARNVLEGLIRIDPEAEEIYRANHAAWLERHDAAAERWARHAEALEGRRAVVYHREFDYLLRYAGVEVAAVIEPKPGVPPTGRHLGEVISVVRREEVPVILTAAWSNGRHVEKVARETDAEVLELPTMVDGNEHAGDWIALIDHLFARLAEGYGVTLPEEEDDGGG